MDLLPHVCGVVVYPARSVDNTKTWQKQEGNINEILHRMQHAGEIFAHLAPCKSLGNSNAPKIEAKTTIPAPPNPIAIVVSSLATKQSKDRPESDDPSATDDITANTCFRRLGGATADMHIWCKTQTHWCKSSINLKK